MTDKSPFIKTYHNIQSDIFYKDKVVLHRFFPVVNYYTPSGFNQQCLSRINIGSNTHSCIGNVDYVKFSLRFVDT